MTNFKPNSNNNNNNKINNNLDNKVNHLALIILRYIRIELILMTSQSFYLLSF